jgi:hypothetical protein
MESSRREFIKNVGLTVLAATVLPKIFSADESVRSSAALCERRGLSFLFQGDSITENNRSRDDDWNHVLGHGYACLIASRLWYNHFNSNLMFYNGGISGNRVRDLDAGWQQDTIDLNLIKGYYYDQKNNLCADCVISDSGFFQSREKQY